MWWAILIPIIFAALSSSRPAQAQGWRVVPRVATGSRDRRAWLDARRQVLARVGVPAWAHRAILAHWARETGYGRWEWNNNPGNIRAFSGAWHGDVVWLRGRDGLLPYRSYPSADAGARDYWRLLGASRYRSAMDALRQGDVVGWYDRLLRSGYSRWSQQAVDEFRRIYEGLSP